MKSEDILHIVNEITLVHNQIGKGEMFLAGFNLAVLQDFLVRKMKIADNLEKGDK